ncbi:hypothetical protein V6N13_103170 [Hibiscus sabdariffa]
MPCCTATQSLLLSPSAYFAAAISALDNDSATTLDSTGIGASQEFLMWLYVMSIILQNRRRKPTSEEADDNNAVKTEHRKRKRDKRDGSKPAVISDGHDGGMKTAKRAKHFGKSMKGHSDGNGKKNFDKGSGTGTGTSRGQKRKMDQATTSQKSM